MLERQGLLLAPWQEQAAPRPAAPPLRPSPLPLPRPVRPILDRDTRQPLGVVRARPPAGWRLFRWLARRTWEVLETEDESLLLSLCGPWGLFRPWEVFDAEDRLVCTIHGGRIFDNLGQLRANQVALPDPPRQAFVTTRGEELAWFRPAQEEVELVFLAAIQDAPFTKMSLLAATLTAAEQRQT